MVARLTATAPYRSAWLRWKQLGVHAVTADDAVAALRLLCDRRDELVAAPTLAVCRPYRLLAELSWPSASAVVGLLGRVARIG
jgi:hypothetical protein